MSSIYERKDSPFFWASFIGETGKEIKRSTKIRIGSKGGKQEARALAAHWEGEARKIRMWGKPKEFDNPPFSGLLEQYLDNVVVNKAKPGNDEAAARHLFNFFDGRMIRDIQQSDINQYIAHRRNTGKRKDGSKGAAASTLNKELAVFRGMIQYGVGTLGLFLPNVADKINCSEPEGRLRWITQEESLALINSAKNIGQSPHLADLIILALNTGMRKGEMLGMERKRIDLNNRVLYLDSMHTKTRKRRSVPLNDAALSVIHRRLQWQQSKGIISDWLFCHTDGTQVKDVKNSFATAVRKAGIEDFRFHDLRHTAASWMVMNGVDIYSVRDVLGHLDITSTQRYAHLAPENLRTAVNAIDSGPGETGRLVAVG